MDAKMKRERSVLRDLFIIICLCIPFVIIVFANAVISLARKVNDYFQSEWKKFNDIHGDGLGAEQQTDPALIAHIKGEDPVPGCYPHLGSEIVENKNQRQEQKGNVRIKAYLHFLRAGNAVVNALLLVPQKIYAYGKRVREDFSELHGDSKADLPHTEPAFIAYLKGEEGAPFIDNPHIRFSKSGLRNLKNGSVDSEIVKDKNQQQEQNKQVTVTPEQGRLFQCFSVSRTSGMDIGKEHIEVMPASSSLASKADSGSRTPVRKTVTEEKPKKKVPPRVISPGHVNVSALTPSNTGPKLFSCWHASPTVVKRTETHVKLLNKGKAHREVMPPSSRAFKADSAARTQECKSKPEKKAKGKVTPPVISPGYVDAPVPTPPAYEQAKQKVMPRLIQTADMYVPASVKAEDQEEKSPIVAPHSSHLWSASDFSDSQVFESQTVRKASAKEYIDVDPTVSRGKRAKNETESEKESWHVQASIGKTENPPSKLRITKRKAEGSTGTSSKSAPTKIVSRQKHPVHVQKLEKDVATANPELMEVVESPPEKPLPEPMEIGGEENVVIFPFGVLGETNQPLVSGSFVEQIEPIEIDQDLSGILSGESESQPMETNQGSVFDEFSFAWENIMQSFLHQPVEEMETDLEPVPAASPCVAQLEAIMETMQEPVIMSMPIGGQFENCQWPLATGMETSEVTLTVPQEETMETNQEQADVCKPTETAFADLVDGKRPLACTVGALKEETISIQTPAAEQSVIQPAMKAAMSPPLVKTEMQSSAQPTATVYSEHLQRIEDKLNNNPSIASIEQQKLVEVETDQTNATNSLTMEQPIATIYSEYLQRMEDKLYNNPSVASIEQQKLVEVETDQTNATNSLTMEQPIATIYSEYLQRMEDKLNNNPGVASIEQQRLVAVETNQINSTDQLTMQQLQIVPENPYLLDSDSDDEYSDEDSDDEPELDIATIAEFSQLNAEPEHEQLIMKLLTERELATESCHM